MHINICYIDKGDGKATLQNNEGARQKDKNISNYTKGLYQLGTVFCDGKDSRK